MTDLSTFKKKFRENDWEKELKLPEQKDTENALYEKSYELEGYPFRVGIYDLEDKDHRGAFLMGWSPTAGKVSAVPVDLQYFKNEKIDEDPDAMMDEVFERFHYPLLKQLKNFDQMHKDGTLPEGNPEGELTPVQFDENDSKTSVLETVVLDRQGFTLEGVLTQTEDWPGSTPRMSLVLTGATRNGQVAAVVAKFPEIGTDALEEFYEKSDLIAKHCAAVYSARLLKALRKLQKKKPIQPYHGPEDIIVVDRPTYQLRHVSN